MAFPDHSVSWNDIKERVLTCVFCDDTLKDPKQLPCLHRVCRACLNAKIEGREGDTLCCLKCSRQIKIPRNGIDGFETDLLAESVGKLNEIYLNFNKKRRHENCCVCCKRSRQLYCFKCKGYLCDRCYNRHYQQVTPFVGHQSALLALRDFSSGDGNVQTIFSHIAPKCKYHPTITASKCCDNCGNEVLCDQCITRSHTRHTIQQISDTVKRSKEDLNSLLSPMKEGIADIQSKLDNIDDTQEAVDNKLKKTSENLQTLYEKELLKIKTVENIVEDNYEKRKLGLKNDLEEEIDSLEKSMEEEIKDVVEKYKRLKSEKREKATAKKGELETIHKREKQKIEETRDKMKSNYVTLLGDLNVTGTKKRDKLLEMMGHFYQTVLHYKIFTATLSIVLATGNDWIAMKEIPGILSAAEELTQDIDRRFPSLASLEEYPPYRLEGMNLEYNESVWEEDD